MAAGCCSSLQQLLPALPVMLWHVQQQEVRYRSISSYFECSVAMPCSPLPVCQHSAYGCWPMPVLHHPQNNSRVDIYTSLPLIAVPSSMCHWPSNNAKVGCSTNTSMHLQTYQSSRVSVMYSYSAPAELIISACRTSSAGAGPHSAGSWRVIWGS
jgi:hypothetical protein